MLELKDISKKYSSQLNTQASFLALKKVSLKIQQGEFLSLLGPSGCGKSTLLRIISGLETPTEGQVLWNGSEITTLTPQDRPFHMVFQKYALFPHMTVFDNIAFGLKIRKKMRVEINQKVNETLSLFNLNDLSQRYPETLSGGQAQRVAVARAIANEPQVLLLDEPLSAIDKHLRFNLQTELKRIQRKLNITFIFVTHDQDEAFAISDRIALFNHGELVQCGTPLDLYNSPQSFFARQFIGFSGNIQVTNMNSSSRQNYYEVKTLDGQKLTAYGANISESFLHQTKKLTISVRPERVIINDLKININSLISENEIRTAQLNQLEARIIEYSFKGHYYLVKLELKNGDQLYSQINVPSERQGGHSLPMDLLKEGSVVLLTIKPEDLLLLGDH